MQIVARTVAGTLYLATGCVPRNRASQMRAGRLQAYQIVLLAHDENLPKARATDNTAVWTDVFGAQQASGADEEFAAATAGVRPQVSHSTACKASDGANEAKSQQSIHPSARRGLRFC